jgi:hypothetical protein
MKLGPSYQALFASSFTGRGASAAARELRTATTHEPVALAVVLTFINTPSRPTRHRPPHPNLGITIQAARGLLVSQLAHRLSNVASVVSTRKRVLPPIRALLIRPPKRAVFAPCRTYRRGASLCSARGWWAKSRSQAPPSRARFIAAKSCGRNTSRYGLPPGGPKLGRLLRGDRFG